MPSSSQSWKPLIYFLSLWFCLLWKCQVNRIAQRGAFCSRLLSLRIMIPVIIHVAVGVSISFIFMAK